MSLAPLRRMARSAAPVLAAVAAAPLMVVSSSAPASAAPAEVTHAQLRTMFGARVSDSPRVAASLPELNRQMRAAGITTPQRQAAFLATLVNESRLDPSAQEIGARARYKGRGYIQLTGSWNYGAASKAVGTNLQRNPADAAHPKHSAAIATWYWATLRPTSNKAADRFDMGRVSRNVGYAYSAREDRERCTDFKRAYKVLSGKNAPASTVCARH